MSINRLQHGDISLTLTKVKISDNGMYRCYLPDLEKESTVQLVVGKHVCIIIIIIVAVVIVLDVRRLSLDLFSNT